MATRRKNETTDAPKKRGSKTATPTPQPAPAKPIEDDGTINISAWYDTTDPNNVHVNVPTDTIDDIGLVKGLDAIAKMVVAQSIRLNATANMFNQTAVDDIRFTALYHKVNAERLISQSLSANHTTLMRRMLAPMMAFVK